MNPTTLIPILQHLFALQAQVTLTKLRPQFLACTDVQFMIILATLAIVVRLIVKRYVPIINTILEMVETVVTVVVLIVFYVITS